MSLIPYGSVIPANIDINDIELQFSFQKDLATPLASVQTLQPTDFIKKTIDNQRPNQNNAGTYSLEIPANFYATRGLGFYHFYLRPRKMDMTIADCAYLEDTDLKGIIVDLNQMSSYARSKLSKDNNVIGYIVQYLEQGATPEKLIPNLFRIATASYRVEPVPSSLNNTQSQAGVRYRLNQNSSLVFIALSPSSTVGINDNEIAFIGNPTQQIIMQNSYFSPKLLQVQITDVDEKSLYYGIFGDQSFNFENGIRTFFDEQGQIYLQKDEFTIKDDTGNPLKKISKIRDSIDFNEDLE